MASARDLKAKIRSTSNTRKITRTMELVATSKAQRAQKRVRATTPYFEKLRDLLANLTAAGSVGHPLLRQSESPKNTTILIVTGKRGLCGGYNTHVLGLAERFTREERAAGRDVDIRVVGRKGLVRMRYLKFAVSESYTHFDDQPSFVDASDITTPVMNEFMAGTVDRFMVFSTRYISAGTQVAQMAQVLPIVPPAEEKEPGTSTEFIFEPDPGTMLEAILPLSVKTIVYRLLVEAVTSEQISRRMAMKRATDSADEMIQNYTRRYNRSRQAGITQQINEIVGGAIALE